MFTGKMPNMVKGGGQQIDFLTISSDHTSHGTAPVYTNNSTEEVKLTIQATGEWLIEPTQLQDDPAFQTFINNYAPNIPGGGGEEVVLDGGTKVGGEYTYSTDLWCNIYGGQIAPLVSTRKVWSGIVRVSFMSGSYTQKNGIYTKPMLKALSQLSRAQVVYKDTLATALVSTSGTSALQTLVTGNYGQVTFISTV